MEVLVRNAEGNVPEKQREYAAKKLSKLNKYFNKATKVEMVHNEQKGKHHLEVTVFADEFTIRGEEKDISLRACIDKVYQKLEARLRSLKGKLIDAHRRRGAKQIPPALTTKELKLSKKPVKKTTDTPTKGGVVTKRKVSLKLMSSEEAVLQMELLGQNFFVFRDADNESLSVIYKIRANKYGIVEVEE
jgi:putative sigma-54 modulation protein